MTETSAVVQTSNDNDPGNAAIGKSGTTLPHQLQAIIDNTAADYSLNELNGRQFYRAEQITDLTYTKIRNQLSREYLTKFAFGDIKKAVRLACHKNRHHPVKRYLNRLEWDKTDRIPALFDLMKIQTENKTHRALIEKALLCFLIACVARIYKPGCKVDSMLVLKGPTGCRKSTLLKLLAIEEEWFSNTMLDLNHKDSLQIINQYWIFEVAELQSFNRANANAVKDFLSRARDDFRPAFGSVVESHDRQVVFCGSTNEAEFLTDPTSNRRFWIVEITGTIDTDGFLEIRDQLWAQAKEAFEKGTPWHLSHTDEQAMADRVRAYEIQDVFSDPVREYVKEHQDDPYLLINNVITYGLMKTPSAPIYKRVGAILAKLGYKTHEKKIKGERHRVWVKRAND